ncbi:MAG: orotidine-5'-phosphate decarboxylase [Desulfobacterales bacterium]
MKTGKDYIIFALDVASFKDAEYYVRALSQHVAMFKIGLELFIRTGPDIVRLIKESSDEGVFLDLKLHDIPVTVERAMEVVADLGVRLTTVHCGESMQMLTSAVSGSLGRVGVLGVTMLTSVSATDIYSTGFDSRYVQNLEDLVLKRASMARKAGCSGVVCSGLEVAKIKKRFGSSFLAVTPGIRPSWECHSNDDQKRVVTPAAAVANGADFVVIGRPIRNARFPADAARRIADEIETEDNVRPK